MGYKLTLRRYLRIREVAIIQECGMEGEACRCSTLDAPKVVALMIETHPAFVIQTKACLGAYQALPCWGLCHKVSLVQWWWVGGPLDGPPALFSEIQLFKADFEANFACNLFGPDIRDAKPSHDIESMGKLSLQPLSSVA